jgi:hypothetical protein
MGSSTRSNVLQNTLSTSSTSKLSLLTSSTRSSVLQAGLSKSSTRSSILETKLSTSRDVSTTNRSGSSTGSQTKLSTSSTRSSVQLTKLSTSSTRSSVQLTKLSTSNTSLQTKLSTSSTSSSVQSIKLFRSSTSSQTKLFTSSTRSSIPQIKLSVTSTPALSLPTAGTYSSVLQTRQSTSSTLRSPLSSPNTRLSVIQTSSPTSSFPKSSLSTFSTRSSASRTTSAIPTSATNSPTTSSFQTGTSRTLKSVAMSSSSPSQSLSWLVSKVITSPTSCPTFALPGTPYFDGMLFNGMPNASFYPTFDSDNATIDSLQVALDGDLDHAVYSISQSGEFGLMFANGTSVFVDFDAQIIRYFTGNCSQELRLDYSNMPRNAPDDSVTKRHLQVRELTKRNPVSFNVGMTVRDNCGNKRVDQHPTFTCITTLVTGSSEYGPSGDLTETTSQTATNLNDGTYAGQCLVGDGSSFEKACNGVVEKMQHTCTHASANVEWARQVLCAIPFVSSKVPPLCHKLIPVAEATLCKFIQSGSVCPLISAFTSTIVTQVQAEGLSGSPVSIGMVHWGKLHDLNFDTIIDDPNCTPATPSSVQNSNVPSTTPIAPPSPTSSAPAASIFPVYNPGCVLDNDNCLAGRGPCTCCALYEIQQQNQCRSEVYPCLNLCSVAFKDCSVYDPCSAGYYICTDKCWATWRTCTDSIAPCPGTS